MGSEEQKSSKIPENPSLPYTLSSTPFNLGLQKLAHLEQVILEQNDAILGSKYAVVNKEGDMVFYVKEEASGLAVELGGTDRAFRINLFDEMDQLAFRLQRDQKVFKKKKMQVFVDEELVSKVRVKRSFLGRLIHINDLKDRLTLKLSGPTTLTGMGEYKFDLFGLSKKQIGSITKLWRGLGNELFGVEQYEVRFPADLDVRYKAAVIGTCILIDIHYYSSYIRDLI